MCVYLPVHGGAAAAAAAAAGGWRGVRDIKAILRATALMLASHAIRVACQLTLGRRGGRAPRRTPACQTRSHTDLIFNPLFVSADWSVDLHSCHVVLKSN